MGEACGGEGGDKGGCKGEREEVEDNFRTAVNNMATQTDKDVMAFMGIC